MEKRSKSTVDWDRALAEKPGWEGLRIWWLIDRDEVGIPGATMNLVDFPPQTAHEVHRHTNAPEISYIEAGSGLLTSDGPPIRIDAGEVAIAAAGEWHGFYNDTDEVARMVTFWPGVDRYADLAYDILPDWRQTLEMHRHS